MSHKKLRTEKNCLNCGHHVEERYCSACGQENLELDDSAFHLAIHYIKDLFHYDGKFWHTLKSLLTRPGLVAKEYMEGKRQRHLEPVRYYVFASTVFFLVFFFVIGSGTEPSDQDPATNYDKRLYLLNQEKEYLKGTVDTICINQLLAAVEIESEKGDSASALIDSLQESGDLTVNFGDLDSTPLDSMSWFERVIANRYEEKANEMERKHEGDQNQLLHTVIDEMVHVFPQLFFLSLPFFAFFLKLLYWVSRKSNFARDFIFSIYHYAYLFTIILCFMIFGWVMNRLPGTFFGDLLNWLIAPMVLYPFIYLYLSMRRFYQDRGIKLVLRYFILLSLLGITLLILFVLLVVISFLI